MKTRTRLLSGAVECFCLLTGETPSARLTFCDNLNAVLSTLKKLFPLVFSINCCFHLTGKNSRNWGPYFTEGASVEGVEIYARKF